MAATQVYYDLYDGDRLDGRYRAAEIMVMLGIRHRTQVDHYSDMGSLYNGRYRIERVDIEPPADALLVEWDRVRMEILGGIRP